MSSPCSLFYRDLDKSAVKSNSLSENKLTLMIKYDRGQMEHMLQRHFWYANDQEIIYINNTLLKDEMTKYPRVINEILGSITWN